MEHARQILDQIAEVHAAVRGEIKDDLGIIKRILDAHKLHFQLVLRNLLHAQVKRLGFAALVALRRVQIGLRRLANDTLQRHHDGLVGHLARAGYDLAQLDAARGLHNYILARTRPHLAGTEIIYLTRLFEADADYRCHGLLVLPIYQIKKQHFHR